MTTSHYEVGVPSNEKLSSSVRNANGVEYLIEVE